MASRALGSLTVDLLLKMGGFKQGMDQAARVADNKAREIDRQFKKLNRSVDSFGRSIKGAFAGIITVGTVRAIIQISDEFTRLEGRLRLVTKSAGELQRVQQSLFGVAQRTRTEFAGVADLYVRLAQAAGELGAGQGDLLKFTEGVSNALIVSGASAQQASGALLQLSQALGGGVVRAEEFNSILEGAPEIVRVVAQSIERFGGSISKLRMAVLAGEVSSREFFEAFLRGSDDLKQRAESMPVTVGQAFIRLRNVFNQAVSGSNLKPLVEAIDEMSRTVSDPEFQRGLSNFVSLVFRLIGVAGKAAASVGSLSSAISEDFRFAIGQMKERERILVEIRRIETHLAANSWLEKDIAYTFRSNAALEKRLELLRAQLAMTSGGGPIGPRVGASVPRADGVNPKDAAAAEKLFEQTRTAAEKFRVEVAELDRLLKAGAITPEIYSRRVAQLRDEMSKGLGAKQVADELERIRDAYSDILDAGLAAIQGLETPVETQIRQYQETKYALEQLAEAYPNMADKAAEALARLEVADLEPIQITAEKIFPKPERDQLSIFFEEASRNFQNLLADFLFDPFKDGIKGMLDSFLAMLQRMAAEAVAAQIASKIFGTGVGSNTGWLGALIGMFGGGSSGLSEIAITAKPISYDTGGYTGNGGKYQPAGLVHAGEFVARSEVVRQPGARDFLESFNRFGMRALSALPGFAEGGFVAPAIAPAMPGGRTPRAGGMSVVNHFTIHAPTGSVSRATEQQIAAAAARGAARANMRNN